jgi:hypothetical protein
MRAGRPELLEGRAQPTHLAFREADELPGLRLREPALDDLPDDGETVQLLAAHLDQLLGHRSAFQATPRRRKRTSLLGQKRTFSFCCYSERTNKRRSVDSVFSSQPSLLPQQTAAGVCYPAAQGSALDERGPAGLGGSASAART